MNLLPLSYLLFTLGSATLLVIASFPSNRARARGYFLRALDRIAFHPSTEKLLSLLISRSRE